MVLDLTITICARQGSKRIQQKNLLKIGGKTLIELAIELALAVVPQKNIIFSSDSDQYIELALRKNVVTHKRGKNLSNSKVSKIEVFKTLSELSKSKYYIDMDVTAPIRDANDVKGLYKVLQGKDVAFAAVKMESINPYFNMVEVKKDGRLATVCQGQYARTQDVPSVFLLNSLIGWERNYLINCKNIFESKNWGLHIMSEEKMFDIDNFLDYEIIKYIYGMKR